MATGVEEKLCIQRVIDLERDGIRQVIPVQDVKE